MTRFCAYDADQQTLSLFYQKLAAPHDALLVEIFLEPSTLTSDFQVTC